MAKPKGPPRVMDVVHPSIGRRPSPTSRPVILADRSYMAADPMLSTTDANEEKDIMSPPDKNDAPELSGAPALSKDTQVTPDLSSTNHQPQQVESAASDVETPTTRAETVDATEKTDLVPNMSSDTTETAPKASEQVQPQPSSTETPEETADQESDDDTADSEADTAISAEPLQPQQVQSPDEVAMKAREDELERMIAAGTYAVPINTIKRRQARLLLIVLAAVLVVLIAVDLLADMKIITLPFGLPHTSFLAH